MQPFKDHLLLWLLAIGLALAMTLTWCFGGERSRHGYGLSTPEASQAALAGDIPTNDKAWPDIPSRLS